MLYKALSLVWDNAFSFYLRIKYEDIVDSHETIILGIRKYSKCVKNKRLLFVFGGLGYYF